MTPDQISAAIELAHEGARLAVLRGESPLVNSTKIVETLTQHNLNRDYVYGVLECFWHKYRELSNARLQA